LIRPSPEAMVGGTVTLVSGVAVPLSISAAEVSTFSTLPGSYAWLTARSPRSPGLLAPGSLES
jgi:hypothetical protein